MSQNQAQQEFTQLARQAIQDATPASLPEVCALREYDPNECLERVLAFALANGLTPAEALPHVESGLTEE